MMLVQSAVADVGVAPDLHGLLLSPRNGNERTVRRVLLDAVPRLTIRRTSEGLLVPPSEVSRLLSVQGILNWSSEARRFAENRGRALSVHATVQDQVERLRRGGKIVAEQLLEHLDGIEKLDDHQLTNVAAMTVPDSYGLCIFDEQGAGKTVSLIYAFDYLVQRDLADILLIIAPKSMIAEWPRDFYRFKADLYKVAVLSGSRQEKAQKLRKSADVLVTNFETAVSMELELRAVLRNHGDRAIIVVDESFFIKNPAAARTRSLRRLREWCGRAYVLCGTPAPNSPRDIVEQFNFVDFGLTFQSVAIPETHGDARQIIQATLQENGIFLRHLKSEVLPELPGKFFHRVVVPLEPKQFGIYRQILEGFVADLRSVTDAQFEKNKMSFLARRTALLQVCSNPTSIVSDYAEVPAKLTALDSLLAELVDIQREKVIIWSFFTASIDHIMDRFRKYSPVRYDGTVAAVEDRRNAVQQFQEDDQTMLFVGNPAAAGAGLTLHRSRVAIYESLSNQAAHYLQSLDRIHRRGQEREVHYLSLITQNTIEEAEFNRLLLKERSAKELLGDPSIEVVSRQSLLSEATEALSRLMRHA